MLQRGLAAPEKPVFLPEAIAYLSGVPQLTLERVNAQFQGADLGNALVANVLLRAAVALPLLEQ